MKHPQVVELDKQYHSLIVQVGTVTDRIYAAQAKENNEWEVGALQKQLRNLTTTLTHLRAKINNLEVQLLRGKYLEKPFSSGIVLNGRKHGYTAR